MSTATQTQGRIKDLRDNLNAYGANILAALEASGLPDATQSGLVNAITRVQAAMQQVTQAPALVAQIVTTPQGARAEKLQLAKQAFSNASDAMNAALTSLQAEAENVRQKIGASLLPKKPAGVSDAMLLDRKADVQSVIIATAKGPTGSDTVNAAAKVLKDALAHNDPDGQLTAYVVAGGPLDLWYQAHSVNRTELDLRIAEALGSISPDGAPAGANLRALLGGGRNTLAGYVDVACTIVAMEMSQASAALARAPYTVQDNPTFPYNGPRP